MAQEQVRSCNGFGLLASVMRITPRHWGVTKAALGVVRNFATNQLNSEYMRQFEMISNLMTILYEAFNIIQHKVYHIYFLLTLLTKHRTCKKAYIGEVCTYLGKHRCFFSIFSYQEKVISTIINFYNISGNRYLPYLRISRISES